jgi:4-hydroxy 2-oxovalerate aldolase
MNNIQILDCTLRDGGYVNDFKFGNSGIVKIISKLTDAGVDIVECGFLEDGEYDQECSVFNKVEQIAKLLPKNRKNTMYVAMACYGEYNLSQLTPYDGTSVDGIRVTFHYNEVEDALVYCKQIQEKGYKVFVQPVGTTGYSDEQLLKLIKYVNELRPYSFYLVDTLGLLHADDVLRFFYLINHNLDASIHMGFHSHNNMQLSFSNSQVLADLSTDRIISLDASVNGMGRGAGNLNTELIANYLNSKAGGSYEIEPLLEIVDEYILKIKQEHEWGYSVPYYLAAINNCHPNYASYLNSRKTLSVRNISCILRMIEPQNRLLFNKELINQKYLEFQRNEIDDTESIETLRKSIKDRNVLLLAPGSSLSDHKDEILSLSKAEDCCVISVSFVPEFIQTDYVFLSNKKRLQTTFNPTNKPLNLIYTSNIGTGEDVSGIAVNYSSLINECDEVRDNASLMLLKLLSKLRPKKVFLAGLDGYRLKESNYYLDRLSSDIDDEYKNSLNKYITIILKELSAGLNLEYVTPSLYNV